MSHVRVHSTRATALGTIWPGLRQKPGPKPKGLWWAVGDAWIDWCRGEGFRIETLRNTFSLDIDDSKILVIGRDMSLDEFDKDFAFDDPAVRAMNTHVENEMKKAMGPDYQHRPMRYMIDWPKVAARWSGIEIPVYSWDHRFDLMWYYGWDVASGCVWNQDAVRGSRKISRKSILRKEVA